MLKDADPGSEFGKSRSSEPRDFIEIGGKVFFTAQTDADRWLWITDGTQEGTRRVSTAVKSPAHLSELNGKLLFNGYASGSGSEPWTSDGTEAGTSLLKDIKPGSSESVFRGVVARTGNLALFEADDGVNGREMWVTDGTTAGTIMLRDIDPGMLGQNNSGANTGGISFNGKSYFYAVTTDPTDTINKSRHAQLWVSDGTPAGTVMLTPGLRNFDTVLLNYDIIGFQNRVFFTFNTPTDGRELWVTDGTPSGTVLFKDLHPGVSSSPNDGWPQDFCTRSTAAAAGCCGSAETER